MSNQHTTMKKFRNMVKELLEYDPSGGQRRLTDWEIAFAERMQSVVADPHASVSIKQAAKLEQIWQEIFGDGR